MRISRTALVLAGLAAHGMSGAADAQPKQPSPPQQQRANPNDPSMRRPPPPPERPYVAPSPGPAPPMQRIEPVPPLSQPPTR
jgi:hypothetical protein